MIVSIVKGFRWVRPTLRDWLMSEMGNKRVGVIGAGTMGRGIAQVFAQAGYEVGIFDMLPAAIAALR